MKYIGDRRIDSKGGHIFQVDLSEPADFIGILATDPLGASHKIALSEEELAYEINRIRKIAKFDRWYDKLERSGWRGHTRDVIPPLVGIEFRKVSIVDTVGSYTVLDIGEKQP